MIPDTATNRPLPAQRAFVVQLHATVEHVVSGQATHFHTLDELLTFMARVLATLDTTPEERP